MGKVLLFTDIHIHPHKRSNDRLNDCLKVLEWVFQTAENEKIKTILFGGDLFHDRQKIDVFTYQKTFEVLCKYLPSNKFTLYLILGNHDLWFNEQTSISSVLPFSSLPNCVIIDKPTRMQIEGAYWDFLPFTHDPINAVKLLEKEEGKFEYSLGHLAIDGAILHGTSISDVVIEHDGEMVKVGSNIFSKYKKVFLGHYHSEQKMEPNIEYIGSPLQLSFGEAFQEKHMIVFDCQTGNQKYVINNFSPQHLILNPEELEKHNLTNNFVRVVVDDLSGTDLIDMRKELSKDKNLGSLEIRQQKKNIGKQIIDDAKSILFKEDEMIEQYIELTGTNNLDKEKLIKVGKMICEQEIK